MLFMSCVNDAAKVRLGEWQCHDITLQLGCGDRQGHHAVDPMILIMLLVWCLLRA